MVGIALAVSAPLLIAPKFFVELILGQQWLQAIPLIRPLIMAGIAQSLISVCYTLFLACKKYRFLNLHLLLGLVLMTGLIILLGKQSGLNGAVNGILISRLITLPIAIAGAVYHFRSEAE